MSKNAQTIVTNFEDPSSVYDAAATSQSAMGQKRRVVQEVHTLGVNQISYIVIGIFLLGWLNMPF